MRVLVTGGAGYIASHMVLDLLENGHFVAVVDNFSTGSRDLLHSGVPLLEACISEEAQVADFIHEHKIDTIIHFSALTSAPASMVEPMLYYENNVSFARTLLQTAINSGVRRFVYSSTAAVYGPAMHSTIAENNLLLPQTPYGSSKLMFETIIKDAAKVHDISYAILRYFNVAGADPNRRAGRHRKQSTNLIHQICRAMENTEEVIPIYGNDYETPDGTCVRDFIHVSDLVTAHRLTLQKLYEGQNHLLLNCGTGKGTSVHEVVKAAEKVLGRSLNWEIRPRRPGDLAIVVADNSKMKKVLDWTPKYPNIYHGLLHEFEWLKAQKNN